MTGDARGSRTLLAGAWVVAMVMLILRIGSLAKGNWADLDVYLGGGQAVLTGQSLYDVRIEGLPFTYPPFAAVLFSALAGMPVAVARAAFTILSLAAYAAVVVVVGRRLHLPSLAWVLLGLGGLSFEPVFRTLVLGQVNILLMALVVVDVLAVRGPWRGFLVGVAAGIKVVPAVFVLWFLMRRQWAAVGQSLCGLLATVIVGVLIMPGPSWSYWSGGFADLGRFGPPAVQGSDNQALVAVWSRLMSDPSPAAAVTVFLCAIGVGLGLAVSSRGDTDDVTALVCLALGGLLASPVSWTHHWVWSVPGLMLLVAKGRWPAAMAVAGVFLVGPTWLVYRTGTAASDLGLADQVIAASYALVAGFVLAVLWLIREDATGLPVVRGELHPVCDDSDGKFLDHVLGKD